MKYDWKCENEVVKNNPFVLYFLTIQRIRCLDFFSTEIVDLAVIDTDVEHLLLVIKWNLKFENYLKICL